MKQETRMMRFLNVVERIGNGLPHPALLFLGLLFLVLLMSSIAYHAGLTAVHPITKQELQPVNLLSTQGLHLIINDMVKNFAGFAPLGSVLVAMLGFSLAEKSGFIATLLRLLVMNAPRSMMVPVVFIAGILSHTAGDIGYVLLIPLAGMVFHHLGLHPLAGIAACFAGVSGGFSANFLLSSIDPLLAGITQEAARILVPQYRVNPLANWYFMAGSGLVIVLIGSIITHKITLPYLGPYRGEVKADPLTALDAMEKRGLRAAGAVFLILSALVLWGLIPEQGFLREIGTGSIIQSPVINGVVGTIFIFGSLTGLAYGWAAGRFRNQNDLVQAMQESMVTMAPYLVLVFFAAQFISMFNASKIGMILAVHGSEFLKDVGLGAVPLMLGFILLTCLLDLVIGSASAKWTLMAPIFVPMFMLLGYAPELTQASYRIADSVVNIISPLMSYFPLILAFGNRYEPEARVGTIVALMLPYSIAFLAFWSCFLFLWMTLEWPLGPGAGLWFQLPTNN